MKRKLGQLAFRLIGKPRGFLYRLAYRYPNRVVLWFHFRVDYLYDWLGDSYIW